MSCSLNFSMVCVSWQHTTPKECYVWSSVAFKRLRMMVMLIWKKNKMKPLAITGGMSLPRNHLETSRFVIWGVKIQMFDKDTNMFDEMSQWAVIWRENGGSNVMLENQRWPNPEFLQKTTCFCYIFLFKCKAYIHLWLDALL